MSILIKPSPHMDFENMFKEKREGHQQHHQLCVYFAHVVSMCICIGMYVSMFVCTCEFFFLVVCVLSIKRRKKENEERGTLVSLIGPKDIYKGARSSMFILE